MLARHVGVVLAIAVGLLALQHRKSLLPIWLACVPYTLWVARTFLLSGTYGGHRKLLDNSLLDKLESFGRVVGHWFMPHVYLQSGGIVIGLVFLLAVFAALIYHARRSPLLALCALLVLGHSVLTVVTASRLFLDVDARTIFPVFWPTLLLVAWGLVTLHRPSRWYYYPVAIYILLWFAAPNPITSALV